MEPELDPLAPANADEVEAAERLAAELDGRAFGVEGQSGELSIAALLRFSAAESELNVERSAELRRELLSASPKPAPRRALLRWLALGLPALGAAVAGLLVIRALLDAPEAELTADGRDDGALGDAPQQDRASAGEAPSAEPPELMAAAEAQPDVMPGQLEALATAAREERAGLLLSARTPALDRAHAQIEGVESLAELRAVERAVSDVLATPAEEDNGIGAVDGVRGHLVRQDLFCRLAETALLLGEPARALEWTRLGLELDGAANPFLAQLWAVDGRARAALGDRLGAARSYLRALETHEALLGEHLDGP